MTLGFFTQDNVRLLYLESLILAQNERWRRASYMQVVREIIPSGLRVKWRTGE